MHTLTRALPVIVERIADAAVPDADLSPGERAAREWRREAFAGLGGADAVSAARRALLDAATGSKIILDSFDGYVFTLADSAGLVNRRSRRVHAIVEQRQHEEQREERQWFEELLAANGARYRVADDTEGSPMILGRLGIVEWGVGSVSLDDAGGPRQHRSKAVRELAGKRSAHARDVAGR